MPTRTTRKGVRATAADTAPAPAAEETAAAPASEAAPSELGVPVEPPAEPTEEQVAAARAQAEKGYERGGLADIWKKRRRQAAEESGVEPPAEAAAPAEPAAAPADGEPVAEPEAAPTEPAPVAEPLAEPAPAEPVAEPTPAPQLVKIKVNGEDRYVTQDDLVKLAQTGLSATEKFQEAARIREETAAMLNNRNSGAERPPASGTEPPSGPTPSPKASTDGDIDLDGAVDAIQFGDKDAAKEALRKIITAATASQGRSNATPEEIAAASARMVRAELQLQQDLTKFGGDFPEIVKDRYLTNITAQSVNQLRVKQLLDLGYDSQQVTAANPQAILATIRQEQAKGRVPSDYDTFAQAGRGVRDWVKGFGGGQTTEEPTPPAPKPAAAPAVAPSPARTEAKAAAPQPPRPASAPRSPTPPPPAPRTPGSVVADMRRARGQP